MGPMKQTIHTMIIFYHFLSFFWPRVESYFSPEKFNHFSQAGAEVAPIIIFIIFFEGGRWGMYLHDPSN